MDLKSFVSESLIQIAGGIKDAQAKQEELGACFAPTVRSGKDHKIYEDSFEEVKFDVAVTVESTEKNDGSAKIVIPFAKIGIKKDGNSTNSEISRLSFSIKVLWPIQADFKDPYQN